MPRLVLAAALGALLVAACGRTEAPRQLAADPTAQRSLAAGAVQGGEGRYGAHAWLGIPFAQPPVGDLRWRAPQPATPWTGVRDSLAPGSPCPQYASPFAGVEGEPGTQTGAEDCLTLDVYAPRFAADEVPTGDARLPVMVWIHGGGNTIGTAAFYDGGHLATAEGVIVVAVQYRLGPFGWFRHPSLRAGAADAADASGNFGTLDLVRALEWVRDNVAAFGGDPGNVTVFGESAGGTNVFTLLLSPEARGLFHRGIVQSGGIGRVAADVAENATDASVPGDPQSSEEILLRLLQQDGAGDRAAAKAKRATLGDAEIASLLRGKSASEILGAYRPDPTGMIQMPRVIADGNVLPAGDVDARFASADGWNRVPVMLGTNRDENRLFQIGDPRYVKKLLFVLPRFVDEPLFLAAADVQSRMWKATGVDRPAAAMRSVEPNVFAYRFDWDEEPTRLGTDLSKMLGASHGFEIPFMFGHFDLGPQGNMIFTDENRPGREELSRAMMSYWANFARTGSPGRGTKGDLPEWKAWDPSSVDAPKYAVLDTAEGGGIRLATETETPESVVARVSTDPRFDTPEKRCQMLAVLAERSRFFTKDQYASRTECQPFPLEAFASR